MDGRAHLPASERAARSRLLQLLSKEPLVCGTAVVMSRRCGNKRCRCMKGQKHVSLYLAVRARGRRQMIYVPPEREESVRRWVETYREVKTLLEVLSEMTLKQFEDWKQQTQGQHVRRRREGPLS